MVGLKWVEMSRSTNSDPCSASPSVLHSFRTAATGGGCDGGGGGGGGVTTFMTFRVHRMQIGCALWRAMMWDSSALDFLSN